MLNPFYHEKNRLTMIAKDYIHGCCTVFFLVLWITSCHKSGLKLCSDGDHESLRKVTESSPNQSIPKSQEEILAIKQQCMEAIKAKNIQQVKHCIEELAGNIDLNQSNFWAPQYYTLLHHAFDCQTSPEIISYLVANGATQGCGGKNVLHLAVQYVRIDVGETILATEQGQELWIKETAIFHRTPLHHAVQRRCLAMAKLLLKHGAQPDVTDTVQETPLYIAAEKGSLAMVQLLLEHKAKPYIENIPKTPLDIAQQELARHEALVYQEQAKKNAAAKQQPSPRIEEYKAIVDALREAMQLSDFTNMLSSTPIQERPSNGEQRESLEAHLHDRPSTAHSQAEYKDLNDAFHGKASAETISSLVSNGVVARDDDNALHLAVQYSRIDVGKSILATLATEQSKDKEWVNQRNRFQHTPFSLAIAKVASLASSKEYAAMVTLLLKHKADPNTKNVLGLAPLHLFAAKGMAAMAKLLLEHGADFDIKNNDDETPLDIAEKQLILIEEARNLGDPAAIDQARTKQQAYAEIIDVLKEKRKEAMQQ